jgi:hypothetical protein
LEKGKKKMALKKYRPITPSQRQLVTVDRSELWKGKPEKSLTEGKKKTVVVTTLDVLQHVTLVVDTNNVTV